MDKKRKRKEHIITEEEKYLSMTFGAIFAVMLFLLGFVAGKIL